MYTVSFYSFKGGVGRTMALVNVAAKLLADGRKVLVVDFDLEAPGVGTYDLFKSAEKSAVGIVDFVSEYIRTGVAPDVRDYLLDGSSESNRGKLWLMPAGLQDLTYATRLSAIDWQRLYKEQDGYLLFEDLKAQWQQYLQPDYVLIDSRTGHTDVGGICTRQLPDAVVALYIPSEQNLSGLQKVVEAIRREAETARSKNIQIHFVPSNVPEIDDEEGIVESALDRAQRMLGYGKPATVVHHYASLSLLNQSVFVRDRPRTRLAKELVALATAIIRENPRDREGALAYLRRIVDRPLDVGRSFEEQSSQVEERLQFIASAHPKDGEILAHLATIRDAKGDSSGALALLTAAIEAGHRTAEVLCRRAKIYRTLSRTDESISDFRASLAAEGGDGASIFISVLALSELDPVSLQQIDWTAKLKPLRPSEWLRITSTAMVNLDVLPAIEKVLGEFESGIESEFEKRLARRQHALVLIAQGKYEEAQAFIAPRRSEVLAANDVANVFNYAMAEWAGTGVVPHDLFQRVCVLDDSKNQPSFLGPNYAQCLAIATYFSKGLEESRTWIYRSRAAITSMPVRTFSCWRYLEVPPEEFEKDLQALDRLIMGENIRPAFMDRSKQGAKNLLN